MPERNAIPISPAQKWLLDRSFARPAAYAFSAWLRCGEPLDSNALSEAWQAVVDHHDALRIRFSQQNGEVLQHVCEPGEKVSPAFIDCRNDDAGQALIELQSHAERISNEAELFNSTLPRLLCAKTSCLGDLLFIFIPHVVTDRYSSRIVIEDLGIAYRAATSLSPIALPQTTASFAQWIAMLIADANSAPLQAECDALLGLPWHQAQTLPLDFQRGENSYANARDLQITLSPSETKSLLELSRVLGIPAALIFVAALVSTIGEWSTSDSVLLDMTALGRDDPTNQYALHRSTGYFSTIHPVVICHSKQRLDSQRIREVDHGLQTAPARGIRYGVLRYLHPNQAIRTKIDQLPRPQIKFNYHGSQPLCDPSWFFQPAQIPLPRTLHADDRRRYLFNIEVMLERGCFTILWKYSAAMHRAETIDGLAENFRSNLQRCLLAEASTT